MTQRVPYLLIALLFVTPITPLVAQSGDAAEVIGKIITAYGGSARLNKIRAYRAEATLISGTTGGKATVVRIVEGHGKLQNYVRYKDREEIRLLDGAGGWRGNSAGAMNQVSGPLWGSMVLQAARLNLPWILGRLGSHVFLGEAEDDLIVVFAPMRADLTLYAYIDPATSIIVRSKSVVSFGGGAIEFETHYSDYRKVDGILFPFHEENYASGTHTGTTSITKVIINPSRGMLQLPIAL